MITLETISSGLALTGLDSTGIGTVIHVMPIAEGALQVIYKRSDGTIKERLLKKLEVVNKALRCRVFNVLGEVFEGNTRTCWWRRYATATSLKSKQGSH